MAPRASDSRRGADLSERVRLGIRAPHRGIVEYCCMSSYPARLIVLLSALVPIVVTALPAAPSAPVTSLGVPARDNATPWIAADGSLVAVTWGASAGAQSDVFLAVSRDAGMTFDSP